MSSNRDRPPNEAAGHCDNAGAVRRAGMRLILLLSVLALASCVTAPVRTPKALDLPEAEPDPLAFLRIAFPIGSAVKAYVITSRADGTSRQVLACAEHENVVGFVPQHDADYVNLYLVQQTPLTAPHGANRYLVVELWRYRVAAAVKICHRWVIWQDDPEGPPTRADYDVLIEDFGNRVLEERSAGIGPDVLERLIAFHAGAVEFFMRHPPENPSETGPAA